MISSSVNWVNIKRICTRFSKSPYKIWSWNEWNYKENSLTFTNKSSNFEKINTNEIIKKTTDEFFVKVEKEKTQESEKKEEILQKTESGIYTIEISKVLPNPTWTDYAEYIEIKIYEIPMWISMVVN